MMRIRDLEKDLVDAAQERDKMVDKLTDKILAMANPAAVREYRRNHLDDLRNYTRPQNDIRLPQHGNAVNFPAGETDLRPPVVERLPTPAAEEKSS